MAGYQMHLSVASVLGAGYGALGAWQLDLDWGPVFLAAGLTTLGGLLPDLDSDSGVPVRELFGLAAVAVPLLLLRRLRRAGLDPDQILVLLAGAYLFIRYGVASVFKSLTVHRGMFHSIPAMLITGLLVFQAYHHDTFVVRLYVSGAVMLGFLSHLVLDELYSVDFMGVRVRLNKYAGSALKLWSKSRFATVMTYLLLGALTWLAWLDVNLHAAP
jgi:hypothetical protein